jgi:hypothetical protein
MAVSPIIPAAKITPELKAIARELKTLTVLYAPTSKGKMSKGEIKSLKAARKRSKGKGSWTGPGNLKRKIGAFNTYDNMILFDSKGKATITIDYAPPGAEYGEYWNDPYKIVSNKPEFNFASKAANDPKVTALIDEYILSLQNQVISNITNSIGTK